MKQEELSTPSELFIKAKFKHSTDVKHRNDSEYTIIGMGYIENTMEPAYAYMNEDLVVFYRPMDEMEDGRFVPVAEIKAEPERTAVEKLEHLGVHIGSEFEIILDWEDVERKVYGPYVVNVITDEKVTLKAKGRIIQRTFTVNGFIGLLGTNIRFWEHV